MITLQSPLIKPFIFHRLPPGKPDPDNPNRRIAQEPCTEITCWDDAVETIRHTNEGSQGTRELFRVWRRDTIAKIEDSLPSEFRQLNHPQLKGAFLELDREAAAKKLQDPAFMETFTPEQKTEEAPSVLPYLTRFITQQKFANFYAFGVASLPKVREQIAGKRFHINQLFLSSLSTTPEELFKEAWGTNGIYRRKYTSGLWKDVPPETKCRLADTFARYICAKEVHGLSQSSWAPDQSIEQLISELKTRGPLVVGGNIGEAAYEEIALPECVELINGIPVYSWKGAEKPRYHEGHAVTLIGAKKHRGAEDVYYLDPIDESKPMETYRRAYKVSYEFLRRNIIGSLVPWPWPEHGEVSPQGYAWAAKKIIHIR